MVEPSSFVTEALERLADSEQLQKNLKKSLDEKKNNEEWTKTLSETDSIHYEDAKDAYLPSEVFVAVDHIAHLMAKRVIELAILPSISTGNRDILEWNIYSACYKHFLAANTKSLTK